MTVQIKNVSVFGDLDVPALRRIVPAGGVIDVDDAELAQSLIDGGHFEHVTGELPQQNPEQQPDGQPSGEQPTPQEHGTDEHDEAAENGSEQH